MTNDPLATPNPMNSALSMLPVGSVVAFAGEIASSPAEGPGMYIEAWGWMACDGRLLATAKYPELYAAIGNRYGGNDESFNIPDLQEHEITPQMTYIICFAHMLR